MQSKGKQGIRVAAGEDRLQERRKVFGTMQIDFKVATEDTSGSLFVIENTDIQKGGPPRHLHHDQDEWFYVVSGRYVIEIGDEKHQLGPGDSILAPRKVPHVWAHVGDDSGRIVIAFQPAGRMEAFFTQLAKVKGAAPPHDEMKKLFGAHGMELLGPPLLAE